MRCYTLRNPGANRPLAMTGVKPHPKTGILWLRLRTPAHLLARRKELEALGVDFRVEHHRSLETRNRRDAASAYAAKRTEIEEVWRQWEELLEHGPQSLSFKNRVALAGEAARSFLETHEDEPGEAPSLPEPSAPNDDPKFVEEVRGLPPHQQQKLLNDLQAAAALPEKEGFHRIMELIEEYPALRASLGRGFAEMLSETYGSKGKSIVAATGLNVDRPTSDLINFELARFMGAAERGLEQRMGGDFGPVPGLDNLPDFEPPKSRTVKRGSGGKALTFESVIAEQERLSALRLDRHRKSAATFKKYRIDARHFTKWRRSENLLNVSRQEVAKWRDEMLALAKAGKMKRTTIRLRITNISGIISWAIRQNATRIAEGSETTEIFPEGNPLQGIDLPDREKVESEERTLTLDQARALLRAARKETDPALRWIPWLIIHSGMRIGEVAQLEKGDVLEHEGYWYLFIRVNDERTTKGTFSRRIPIHRAVIAEGFLEFAEAAPEGRLFRKGDTPKHVRKWAHGVMAELGGYEGKPPLHSARHLFSDLMTGKVEMAAQYYIEGRVLPGSKKDYGKSAAMVPEMSRMIDDIEPLLPMAEQVKN